jgi:PAS domain S-box-containing protein
VFEASGVLGTLPKVKMSRLSISNGVDYLSFVCDPQGYVQVVNLPWLDYTGLSVEQSLGDAWRCAIRADILPRFEAAWDKAVMGCEPAQIDLSLRRYDGVFTTTILHLMPLHDPSGGVQQWHVSTNFGSTFGALDGAAEEELSEERWRTIIDALPICAWMTAKDGPAEFLNKCWLDYTGLSIQEAIGYSWEAVLHPDDFGPLFEYWMNMIRTGRSGEFEARLKRYDGEYRWFLFRGAPFLDSTGALVKWFGVNIDIHERKTAEAVLRRTEAALIRANQLATIGELTASIAHEVNQPLVAVVANAEAALQWLDRPEPNLGGARQALLRIARDGNDAGEIVRRVRALFRRATPVTAQHRLEELVTEVLKLLQNDTIRRSVKVEIAIAEGLPTVVCDRVQIQQVILNLIMNAMDALDAIPEGEKTIRVFSTLNGADSVILSIRDYGEGVKDSARLFETFFTTKEKGLGMGLAISRSIVEAHGGQLWLEPADGPGSTFCFRLPVKRSSSVQP